jgi:Acetyltransferase (GNAT) family
MPKSKNLPYLKTVGSIDVLATLERRAFSRGTEPSTGGGEKFWLTVLRDDAIAHNTNASHRFMADHLGHRMTVFNWASVYSFHPTALVFAIWTGTRAAALMQIQEARDVPCRPKPTRPVVYVSFLEVMPGHTDLRGLGAYLIGVACDRAFQLGLNGRVGLHSVRGAEDFYRRLGFKAFDCHNEYHEIYFEINEKFALKLTTEGVGKT